MTQRAVPRRPPGRARSIPPRMSRSTTASWGSQGRRSAFTLPWFQRNAAEPHLPWSIPVLIRLVRAADRDADIGRLFVGELGELDADLVEMQPRDLLIKM